MYVIAKGLWGVLEGLLMLAVGVSIVAAGGLFLRCSLLLLGRIVWYWGGSIVAGRDLLFREGSTVAGCWRVY